MLRYVDLPLPQHLKQLICRLQIKLPAIARKYGWSFSVNQFFVSLRIGQKIKGSSRLLEAGHR